MTLPNRAKVREGTGPELFAVAETIGVILGLGLARKVAMLGSALKKFHAFPKLKGYPTA